MALRSQNAQKPKWWALTATQILLREPVLPGQILTMTNILTNEEIACTVIDLNHGQAAAPEVGVEFAHPCPRFWRVSFPPSD